MAGSRGKLPFTWSWLIRMNQQQCSGPTDSLLHLIWEQVSVCSWKKILMKPVGQVVWETAGAVLPGEIRDIDIRGQKKKHKQNPLFLRRGLHWVWFKKSLKAAGFRARLERNKDTVGKGRFIVVFSYFYCLTKQASLVSLKRSIVVVWDKINYNFRVHWMFLACLLLEQYLPQNSRWLRVPSLKIPLYILKATRNSKLGNSEQVS